MSVLRIFLLLALAAFFGAADQARAQAAAAEEGALLAELETKREEADPAVIKRLAALRTPGAAKGLVDVYGHVASIWLRREILRALAEFDGVAGAGQTALDLVANVAGNATEPEIRDAAFETLARCKEQAQPYLARLVESGAQEQVRERALELHAKSAAGAAGASFYRRLFEDEKAPKKLRRIAFEALAQSLDDAELAKWLKDAKDDAVRRIALAQLASRKAPSVADLALDLVKRVNVLPTERAEAARILLATRGAKAADDLIDVAVQQATTPELLRESIAEQLGGLGDDGVNKKLLALVGKGKPHEQRFALLATRPLMAKGAAGADDKLLKKVRSHLDDKELELRRVAIRIAGEQKDVAAADALDKLLAKPKDPGDAPLVVLALSQIRAGDGKWHERLVALSGDARRDVRNAALQALEGPGSSSGSGDPKDLPLFVSRVSHEDWSTRLVAVKAIERRRDRDALGAVIAQMQKESGRMLSEFGDALFRLTGEPFDVDAPDWLRWWNGVGKDMPLISAEELAQKVDERERKRLKQTTSVRFFGVKIESHDVAFVVDVSGSMAEPMLTTTIDGRPATRMEVVKREIEQCLKALDATAFFNLITFNSAVMRWKDGVAALNDKTRAEALDYVSKLGSRGGTNIYDALAAAFEDPRVDTIFLLTDGEPSAGTIIDLQLIREHVKQLNETRHVIIHCIGVGGDFPLLEWIAADAGGTYIKHS